MYLPLGEKKTFFLFDREEGTITMTVTTEKP